MLQFIPAKINIGLNITGRRPDGYHDLSTIFYPIGKHNGCPESPYPFCDILEITPAQTNTSSFVFTGRKIDCPLEKNLIYKAAQLFFAKYEQKCGRKAPAFDISLCKCIPDGAGIGGGSADATYTLRLLNALNDDIFSSRELAEMAVSLGADCPFFLLDTPAYAEGIGEILSPVSLPLAGKWLLLVKPEIYISTAEAFRNITPARPTTSLDILIRRPIEEWKECIFNDFEKSVNERFPEIREIKQHLYRLGAVYASMSGSGSSLYGIFDDRETAEKAIQTIDINYKTLILL